MDLNDFLQGARLIAHILTVALVAAYCPEPGSAKRPGVSLSAILLAGGSACLAVSLLLNWHQWAALPVAGQIALTFIFGALLAPVWAGRGNVASLFPRRVWSHRP